MYTRTFYHYAKRSAQNKKILGTDFAIPLSSLTFLNLPRVAVVDFDYHAGNGTHYCLRGDPRFHFTSFHAYHHGSFWPYSSEFDYDTQYGGQV
ncbi:hypothetical protein ANCCAN_24044 [Ancylostoma caninum]|uniref:Histone deacetylase domain-containing protein n=1 Tax=Ancylostoma caninum TaxID=29170 RepID=A0A368FJ40_ANCCA|nr:hypothetical protein ANCCAN_24044 [Ancylostoma caninum]